MCYRLLPESPRWLYAVGRNEEGDTIVRKIAKYNKHTLPEKLQITVIVSKLPRKIGLIKWRGKDVECHVFDNGQCSCPPGRKSIK